nr:MAG TPA: hypothetical protein [Caudoviricetes sp.]
MILNWTSTPFFSVSLPPLMFSTPTIGSYIPQRTHSC